MKSTLRGLYLFLFLIPFSLLMGVINVRLYYAESNPQHADVVEQLAFIRERLHQGAGDDMQQFFPEGYFFSHALYGLTWVDVGLKDASLTPKAITEASWALKQLESPQGKFVFSNALTPPYGVFYVGWSNWLRGGLLKLQKPDQRDPNEVERFTKELTELAAAFDESPTPFLQAYPNLSWPVDNTVAVAALHLHDTLFTPQFETTINNWEAAAKAKIDPNTGLLPHEVNYATGHLIQGSRGSSQSVIQRFLPEIDPVWAREQYPIFRAKFVDRVFGVPGIREYPIGIDGEGDVDSGPLLAGMSLSASVVTAAAAQVEGDTVLANSILDVGEALGIPITIGGSKRYALGVLPIGDAFVAWAKSSTPWTFTPAPMNLPEPTAAWWRWPIQALTVLAVVILWWLFLRRRKPLPMD